MTGGALTSWTFCSGIGAPEAAMPHWRHALACEIEPFPRAVLMARFGFRDEPGAASRLYLDMTTFDARRAVAAGVPLPDVIVAGTPCQAFSVAGARRGLADARGNLTLRLVEIYRDTIELARAAGRRPPVLLWENVPGVLSDSTNALGCFMGALVGGDDPLPRPADGSWPGAGMASGPGARLAWRLLDAQYFGLAQRRRRVFVVVDPGAGCDPAAVLFERAGLRRDPPSRREEGQDAATCLAARTRGGGGLGTDFDLDGGLIPQVSPTLRAGGNSTGGDRPSGTDVDTAESLIVSARLSSGQANAERTDGGRAPALTCLHEAPIIAYAQEIADPITANEQRTYTHEGSGNFRTRNVVAVAGETTHALTGEGHDASEDGTGRGTPVIAFHNRQDPDCSGDVSPTLRAMGHGESHANAGWQVAVAFDLAQITSAVNRTRVEPGLPVSTLSSASQMHVATRYAVRRMTPRECERLQGFPDDWTLIPGWASRAPRADMDETARWIWTGDNRANGMTWDDAMNLASHPDGPRYKALGNSMAVPVMRWIMERIERAVDQRRRDDALAEIATLGQDFDADDTKERE